MNRTLKGIGVVCPALILSIVLISGCSQTSSSAQATDNCNQISGSSRDLCYTTAAYKAADASLCGNVNDTLARNQCYHDVAFKLNDSSICDNIGVDGTFFLKTRCMALATENATICDSIDSTSSYKNTCYLEVSGKTQNLTLCRTILSSDDKCNQYFQTLKK